MHGSMCYFLALYSFLIELSLELTDNELPVSIKLLCMVDMCCNEKFSVEVRCSVVKYAILLFCS